MTTSSSEQVALAPGHRCLLDLLQRKLLQNIELYARLRTEANQTNGQLERAQLEGQLLKLKEKIKRISARQRRYTLEIINGNGNNTIPKETFFQALGLVTREALIKLNSKTNERRRRTTANPRFSHEAVQARRLADVISRNDNKKHQQQLQQQQQQQQQLQLQQQHRLQRKQQQQDSIRYKELKKQIAAKVRLIQGKQANNKKLEEQNEHIEKHSLNIISALKMIIPNLELSQANVMIESNQLHSSLNSKQHPNQQQNQFQHDPPPPSVLAPLSKQGTVKLSSASNEQQQVQPQQQADVWIDMKCDESLDGVD